MGQHPYWAVLWLILPTTSLSMSRARLWAQIFPTKILPPILFLNQTKTKQKPTTKKPNQFPKRSIQPLSSDTQIAWHIHLIFCLDCWAGWLATSERSGISQQSEPGSVSDVGGKELWQWVPLLQLLFPPAGGSNCWVMAHEPPPEPGGALQEPAPRCEQTMQLAGFHNVLLWVTFPGKIIRGRPCLPLIIGFISSRGWFQGCAQEATEEARGRLPS